MGKFDKPDIGLSDLRRKASEKIRTASRIEEIANLSPPEIASLINELQVYQAELEIQNEELRQAQVALQESVDQYVELYDFAPVGYFTLDRRGIVLKLNLSASRMVGRERSNLVNKPFSVLIAASDHGIFFSHLKKAFNTRSRQVFELTLNVTGKTEIRVRLEGLVRPAQTDEPETCFVAVSDISETHRMRQEVLKTQEHIMGSMQEGVCVCDETGMVTFTNPAFNAMFDEPSCFMTGRRISALTSCALENNRARLDDMLHHLKTHKTWNTELKCARTDGTIFKASVRATSMDLFGKKTIIQVWGDVTELRHAEGALRESERLFSRIMESTTDLIWLKDRWLRYTYVNPALASLHGRAAENLIGKTYEEVFDREDSAYFREVDRRVLAGETLDDERAFQINGATMWFHQLRIPLRDADGSITGMCVIARDITERKRREAAAPPNFGPRVSKAMAATLAVADQAARTDSLILLTGESGSGKDYLARYIHDHSKRAGGPYLSLNCAAISATLAESELFGHERGAFTGAQARKRGLLELAEGGTLLLNEIGELPAALQAKLLTFLDTKKFTRVGGEREITVNARLLTATNRDLHEEVKHGRFRQDLFFRLNVMTIEVPPLRRRIEDLPELVQHFLSVLSADMQLTHPPSITPSALRQLSQYHWPGNVRELRNVLERMLIVGDLSHFSDAGRTSELGDDPYTIILHFDGNRTLFDLTEELTSMLCVEALKRSSGNKREASRILGVSRDTFYRRLKTLGLDQGSDAEE